MVILLFVCLASALQPKEFLEGLLSGLQGTEVVLGEECLDSKWADDVVLNFNKVLRGVRFNEILSLGFGAQRLWVLLGDEYKACHMAEALEIYRVFTSISLKSLLTKGYVEYWNIAKNLYQGVKSPEPRPAGKSIGKALNI